MAATKKASPHDQDSVLELHEGQAAYLVHLIRSDAENWDPRRRLSIEEALEIARRLEERLPVELRRKLERLNRKHAA